MLRWSVRTRSHHPYEPDILARLATLLATFWPPNKALQAFEALPLLAASAPRAALPPIWTIPYPRNPFFLGRESELAQIRHFLLAGQTPALSQPQAISGLGGIVRREVV